jgi:hypothetical protein
MNGKSMAFRIYSSLVEGQKEYLLDYRINLLPGIVFFTAILHVFTLLASFYGFVNTCTAAVQVCHS